MAEEATAAPPAPIIIKRIKKGGAGHHGGSWKVAYADFVTAMMAFFLLLWLINVTTPEQKRGLAEYFTPTIGIKDSEGIGFKGGANPMPEGRSKNDLVAPGIVLGQPKQGPINSDTSVTIPDPNSDSTAKSAKNSASQAKDNNAKKDQQDEDEFKMLGEEVQQALEQDTELKNYRNDVVVDDSPEGLKIDLIDDEKKPMFIPGTATLTETGKKVLDSMAGIILKTPNNIMIKGHTDASGVTANPQYTNWELSADRANAARRFLFTTQLETERVNRVVGMADRELLVPEQPDSPRNRRVTIVLMRGSYFRDPKSAPNTRALLSVPDARPKKPAPKPKPQPAPDAIPKNGPSIFDPGTLEGQPMVVPKATDAEVPPELSLPTPKPPEAKKPAPAPAKPANDNVPNLPIFDSVSPQETPVQDGGQDQAPELDLSLPQPKGDAAAPEQPQH